VGITEEFLAKEYKKAVANRLSPPCGKPFGAKVHHTNIEDARAKYAKPLVCYQCGIACDLTQMKEERINFLKQLGAEKKDVITRNLMGNEAISKKLSRQPSPKFAQSHGAKYQAEFTKIGQAAYLSHLDLIRLLQRIFRRSGLKLNYTQGFHPIPKMSFSPALSLGMESLGEWVEFELAEETPRQIEELRCQLNRFSPSGVYFKKIEIASLPFQSRFKIAQYLVLFPSGWNGAERAYLDQKIAELKAQFHLSFVREQKGQTKTLSMQTSRLNFVWHEEGVGAGLKPTPTIWLDKSIPTLEVQIEQTNEGTLKLPEILLHILSPLTQPTRFLRLGFSSH